MLIKYEQVPLDIRLMAALQSQQSDIQRELLTKRNHSCRSQKNMINYLSNSTFG